MTLAAALGIGILATTALAKKGVRPEEVATATVRPSGSAVAEFV